MYMNIIKIFHRTIFKYFWWFPWY